MKLRAWLLVVMLGVVGTGEASAQLDWKLTPGAQLSLLTFSPGAEALYARFGHTALRVVQPELNQDLVFNWGLYDFNQPGFYTNFLYGKLDYALGAGSYQAYFNYHVRQKRAISEVVLDLTPEEKQAVWQLVMENYLPENRHYNYDFFYDNCATRPRDILEKVLGPRLRYPALPAAADLTWRSLIDTKLPGADWGHLGINLVLGTPVDQTAGLRGAMFLPQVLEAAWAGAEVERGGQTAKLVPGGITLLFEPGPAAEDFNFWTSPWLLWLLPVLALGLSWPGQNRRLGLWLDVPFFLVIGLLGLLLAFLWLFTMHAKVTAPNLNVLWMLAPHAVAVWFLLAKRPARWTGWWFAAAGALTSVFVLGWPFWPQRLDAFSLPLVLTAGLRSLHWAQALLKPVK